MWAKFSYLVAYLDLAWAYFILQENLDQALTMQIETECWLE